MITATPEDKARWAKADQEKAAYSKQKIDDPKSQFEYDVCKAVQEHVRDTLVAPSTADFPHCHMDPGVSATYKGNGYYEVYSYVDAQNGFGAMLRTKYWAGVDIVTVDADGYKITKWTLRDFGVIK
jgi:hypothetical protein